MVHAARAAFAGLEPPDILYSLISTVGIWFPLPPSQSFPSLPLGVDTGFAKIINKKSRILIVVTPPATTGVSSYIL